MRALTICQPYAHLIMIGEKPVENRTWPSGYHGPLLIHAGKSRSWLDEGDENRYDLVFGAILGQVTMRGSLRPQFIPAEYPDIADNEHVHGPHCFILSDPVLFNEPIPWRGRQGFFNVPDSVTEDQT